MSNPLEDYQLFGRLSSLGLLSNPLEDFHPYVGLLLFGGEYSLGLLSNPPEDIYSNNVLHLLGRIFPFGLLFDPPEDFPYLVSRSISNPMADFHPPGRIPTSGEIILMTRSWLINFLTKFIKSRRLLPVGSQTNIQYMCQI